MANTPDAKTNTNSKVNTSNKAGTNGKTKPSEKQAGTFPDICKNITSGIVAFFVLVVLLVFPCYYRDFYFDILEAKYVFYYIVIIAMLAILLIASIIYMIIDRLEFKFEYTKAFFAKLSPKNWKESFGVYDWFLLAFLVVVIISTLQSGYQFEAFWGNEGRFTGLFLHLLYIFSFWIVSRFYEPKPWHWNAFLLVAMWPLIFGITDFFRMDILHFKVEIPYPHGDRYVSTFGNVNTYTTYVGMVFGASMVLFTASKKWLGTVFYYICMVISIFALIMGISDNSYLAILMMFGFLPLYAFRSNSGFRRYFLSLATFFTVACVTSEVANAMGDKVLQLTGVFDVLADSKYTTLMAGALWMLAVLIYIILYRMEKKNQFKMPANANPSGIEAGWSLMPVKVWYGVIAAVALVLLFLIFDANRAGNSEKYGALSNYLVASDNWGSHRGYIWRTALEEFSKQPILHKLFGFGLDTFGLLLLDRKAEAMQIYGEYFDSAHNEYLQYFVTAGVLGLVSYMGFLISLIARLIRRGAKNPPVMAVVFGALCYLAQALVTINLPIATPVFWMLLAIGAACCREKDQTYNV